MKKIIATLLVAMLTMGILCSCGAASPTDVTKDYLEALKKMDEENIKELYAGDMDFGSIAKDQGIDDSDFSKELTEELENKILSYKYEIQKEEINDNKATVTVKITTYDLGTVMTKAIGEYFTTAFGMALSGSSEEAMEKVLEEKITDGMKNIKQDYEKTVKFHLSKKEDKWIIDDFSKDKDIIDAFTGGMVSAFQGIADSFNGLDD